MPRFRLPAAPLRAALLVALCAALGACAAPPRPAASGPAASVAHPADPPSWDGAYHGTSTRFRADARDCPHPGLVTLYVAQGQLYYNWGRGTDVAATVAPDGTVRGSGPGITLTGTVHGKRMEGDVANAACGLHFTVTRAF